MKKHRTLIFAVCFLVLAISLFFTGDKKSSPQLSAVDKLIKKVNLVWKSEDPELHYQLKNKIQDKLSKLETDESENYYFWLLKARYSLVENLDVVLHKDGSRSSPSDEEGYRHVQKAQSLCKFDNSLKSKALQVEILLLEGNFLLRMDKSQKAANQLEKAWKLSEKNSQYCALKLSEAYIELSSEKPLDKETIKSYLEKSSAFAEKAKTLSMIASQVTSPDAYNQKALVLMRQKDYFSAEAELKEAIKLRPKFAKAHFNRGLCLAALSVQYNSGPKEHAVLFESYRTQLLREVEELRALDLKLSNDLFQHVYLNKLTKSK